LLNVLLTVIDRYLQLSRQKTKKKILTTLSKEKRNSCKNKSNRYTCHWRHIYC